MHIQYTGSNIYNTHETVFIHLDVRRNATHVIILNCTSVLQATIITICGSYLQNSTPMRHKATHFFNVPHYANKVFEFFIALLNDKLKDRIMVSGRKNAEYEIN